MSNAKPIMIHIKSLIAMKGEEDQTMDLMTEGKYYEKVGSHYLVYEESEVSGMEGDKTTIKLKDGRVAMHRYGQNHSELTFEQGCRHNTIYKTPHGEFDMEVLASEVSYTIDERGNGAVSLVYALSIKGIGESKTTMSITMKEAGE